MHRAEGRLEELNQRIARLALLLGVQLDSPLAFERILKRQDPHLTPRGTSGVTAAEQRLSREWEELRGLLVLRCDLIAEDLSELGLASTLAITANVETRLLREGFGPGADGLDLFDQMNPDPTAKP